MTDAVPAADAATSSDAAALRVAIVGCGIIGSTHARAVSRVPGFRIVAVVDPSRAAAERLAELIESELARPRPVTCRSLSELRPASGASTGEPVDVAIVCTPSGTHLDVTERALGLGLHVVLEKPLEVTVSRGRRLVQLAERAAARGLMVSVISQHRFDPASVVVAAAAADGRFGRLTGAVASVAWWRSQGYYDSAAWRGTFALDGGGALMNQGVHTVDLLLWLLGTPVEVFGQTALLGHEGIEVEDVAVATVRFASGALAVLHATTAAHPGLSARLQLHGTRGSAVIDDDRLALYFADGDDRQRAAERGPTIEHAGVGAGADAFVEGHARQYRDIADAIRDRRPPGVGVADAMRALAVVRAIYTSAALGRTVLVDDILRGELGDEAPALVSPALVSPRAGAVGNDSSERHDDC